MIANKQTVVVHLLVILFGAGAWIAVNGVWVELPQIVSQAPESWNLPAYLTVISQVGNLGPLIVTLMQVFFSKYYKQNAMIYSIVTIGTVSCLLLCFFWDATLQINDSEYSVALFVLWFSLAFVDCSSSVTFLPFMTIFPSTFLTTYFIGEGLSGLFPSIFALAQGVGHSQCVNKTENNTGTVIYSEPRFSVQVFFVLLCVMMAICSVAFVLLNHLGIAKSLHIKPSDESYTQGLDTDEPTETTGTGFYNHIEMENSGSSLTSSASKPNDSKPSLNDPTNQKPSRVKLQKIEYVYLLFLIFTVNSISNGILPSVSSYSALPYGETPYHLATALGNMANPLACLVAFFLPMRSYIGIGVFSVVSYGLAAYLLFLAIGSPCPVLVNQTWGAVLMVLSQILFVGFASYVKVSIAQIFREKGHKRSLVVYGAVVQAGSMTGALTMFPLVNIKNFFKSSNVCDVCA